MSDYTLCWSKRQNAFHIEPLDRLLERNRAAYRDDRALNDYHLLHIGARSECEAMAEVCRGTMRSREQLKAFIRAVSRNAQGAA